MRCKRHCMMRVPAPSPGYLRFHTFHSKRMSSECVGTMTPPPPHLMKRVSHMLGGTSLVLQGQLSYGVLHEVHNHCDDPKPVLPPLPQDQQEVEPAFDLLKSMAAIGRAALGNLILPPPLVHAAGDAVVLVTALGKFIGGVYNTELPPTVALENIAEAGYIIYLIQLWCQPFRDCWYLHFLRKVQAFLVITAFLQ